MKTNKAVEKFSGNINPHTKSSLNDNVRNFFLSLMPSPKIASSLETYNTKIYLTISEGWNCPINGITIHLSAVFPEIPPKAKVTNNKNNEKPYAILVILG